MKRTTGTCFLTGALLSLATDALAQGNDSIPRKWVDGNFYTEANYGYNFFGDKRDTYDFPHAVVDLNIGLPALGLSSWMRRATYSLPVPLAPRMRTDMGVGATKET
jgi:hypothetical protein